MYRSHLHRAHVRAECTQREEHTEQEHSKQSQVRSVNDDDAPFSLSLSLFSLISSQITAQSYIAAVCLFLEFRTHAHTHTRNENTLRSPLLMIDKLREVNCINDTSTGHEIAIRATDRKREILPPETNAIVCIYWHWKYSHCNVRFITCC